MYADALSNDSTAATRPCARSRSRSPRARTSASTQKDSYLCCRRRRARVASGDSERCSRA
ncbi:Uncharacterised protein [Mycobacteroides abscessus subsp. abscessus]|nr:Uncharacterised protein [Mycobacteroides abscessus subsp. abscessus]